MCATQVKVAITTVIVVCIQYICIRIHKLNSVESGNELEAFKLQQPMDSLWSQRKKPPSIREGDAFLAPTPRPSSKTRITS